MRLQESGEMYLETILNLSKSQTHVRSIDVSETMGYSKPSVSRAVGLLKTGGYIEVDKDGFITLTESGSEIAEKTDMFWHTIGVVRKTTCRVQFHIAEHFDCF